MDQIEKLFCNKCKEFRPACEMALVNGKPRGKGICKGCRNLQRRTAYWQRRINRTNNILLTRNVEMLSRLAPGDYELIFIPSNESTDGYFTVTPNRVEVIHCGKWLELEYNIPAVARFLTDRNLFVSGKSVTVEYDYPNTHQEKEAAHG